MASAGAPEAFSAEALGAASEGCKVDSDCVLVLVFGSCWPITTAALAGPLAARYRDWSEAGHGKASGSPDSLEVVLDVPRECGLDWSGVSCRARRCELTPSDCEFGGMRRSACLAKGGAWGGCAQGRGRLPGCNFPTSDGGKECVDSADCEGVCVHGACSKYLQYRGCGVLRGGRTLCVE